jgi:hypothetical protein
MKVYYVRVSTVDQKTDRQRINEKKDQVKKLGTRHKAF